MQRPTKYTGNFEGTLARWGILSVCTLTFKINRDMNQLGLCPTKSGAVKIEDGASCGPK